MYRIEVGLRRALFHGTTPASLREPRPRDDGEYSGPKVSVRNETLSRPIARHIFCLLLALRLTHRDGPGTAGDCDTSKLTSHILHRVMPTTSNDHQTEQKSLRLLENTVSCVVVTKTTNE